MSSTEEQEFLDLLRKIDKTGFESSDRTGVGTKYLVGITLKYDLSNKTIPIWTTRKINWKNQVWELIWFLRGDTNVKWLQDRGVNIWNSWVKEDGTIGPGYGQSWRAFQGTQPQYYYPATTTIFGGKQIPTNLFLKGLPSLETCEMEYRIDQFKNLIDGIKQNPESRRHIVSLWNPAKENECILPPCHGLTIQFIVQGKELHCIQYQRSADMLIGYCPWQYALLTNIVAELTGLQAKSLTMVVGNAHIYNNQSDGLQEQLSRIPTSFPKLHISKKLNTIQDVEESELQDYELIGYYPQKFIKFPIAV